MNNECPVGFGNSSRRVRAPSTGDRSSRKATVKIRGNLLLRIHFGLSFPHEIDFILGAELIDLSLFMLLYMFFSSEVTL